MNSKQTLDRLISLTERLLVENDEYSRTLAEIEIQGDLPKELIDARVMRGILK